MSEQPNLITPNYNQSNNLPNATASLVLGIISIVGSFCYGVPGLICGIIGLVLANKDKKLYESYPEAYSSSSYSTSKSGRVCSIIGLILSCLFVLLIIVWIIFFGTIFMEAMRNGGKL